MRSDFLPFLFSFVWPAAFLVLLFSFVPRPRRLQAHLGVWLAAMIALAAGIVSIPVGGLPLGRWFTGLCANLSLPLLAWIASAIGRRMFNVDLLGEEGRRAAVGFGVAAGGALYPMALGLGGVDPYSAGWSFSWLFAGTGALTALLLWRANRFGLVLLAAVAAYHLGLLESENYWDYLVDPLYFVASLVGVGRLTVHALRRRESSPKTDSSGDRLAMS